MPTTPTKDLSHIAAPLRQFAVETDLLNEDPENARSHDERSLEAVEATLKRYGQRVPIIVQKAGMVVRAGNARLDAARNLGWRYIAAVIVDEANVDAAAYAIASNRTAELSSWDIQVLAHQLEQLAAESTGLEALGFTAAEAEALRGPPAPPAPADTTEGETPKRPKKPTTRAGDFWRLGRHRLLCASCADDCHPWIRLVHADPADQARPAAVITDPPYGINYKGGTEDALTIAGDSPEGLDTLLRTAFDLAKTYTRPGAVWYVFAPSGTTMLTFARALRDQGVWQQTLVWKKQALVLGRTDYHYQHETVFYGWTPEERGQTHLAPPPTTDSVLLFDRPQASRDHPTMKPVGMLAELMARSTRPGDIVLDPFLGSGSTLIAADQMSRRCWGFEIDPGYCDVIVRRYQALTAVEAERCNADGERQPGVRLE
jgi:site-specific DNA-methyltransferase (adenine-specific)